MDEERIEEYWNQRYGKHEIHSTLKLVKEKLSATLDLSDEASILELRRAKNFIGYIQDTLYQCDDKVIISPKILSDLILELTTVNDDLEKYLASKEINIIIKINVRLSSVLKEVAFLFIPNNLKINVLIRDFDDSNEMVFNLRSIKKQVDGMEKIIEEQKNRLQLSMDQIKDEYNKATKDWSNKLHYYDKALESAENTLGYRVSEITNKYITELEEAKEKVQAITNIIGGTGLAGDYHKIANKAQWITLLWHGITGGLLIFLVWIAYQIAFFTLYGQDFSWTHFLPKVMLISVIAIAIKYTANQVLYYQQIEEKNRKIQLELVSLDAYLAVFQKDEANKLREKLASNYFVGHNDAKVESKKGVELEHWGKPIIDLLKDLYKKNKE